VHEDRSKVLVLRARPRWSGPAEKDVDGRRVLVRPVASHLAALDALAERGPDDFLVLLTGLSPEDLGDAVLVRTQRAQVDLVDEWSAVPGLFGAHTTDVELRRQPAWVPAALLEFQPAEGWPVAPSGILTADHALGNLLGALLGVPLPFEPDLLTLLDVLDQPEVRTAWCGTREELRSDLTRWFARSRGEALGMALDAAARSPLSQGGVSVVALGLALDVLWPEGPAPEEPEQVLARGRIEARISGTPVRAEAARTFATTARTLLLRMDALGDPASSGICQQAEALLADIGWTNGAERSLLLPAGLSARLRALAAALEFDTSASLLARMPQVEGALKDVLQHHFARPGDSRVEAARMAVRLARWISSQEAAAEPDPDHLGASLTGYLDDGAWVDRAVSVVWDGSTDPVVSAAYRRVIDAALALRRSQDLRAAAQLAGATARDEALAGAVKIEEALGTLVAPIATAVRPLVILLDGMSAPVAAEIAEGVTAEGWLEVVPEARGRRQALLAALPTLTKYSRTAFFTGTVTEGGQSEERAGMLQRFGSPLFHKDTLRAPAGDALSPTVLAAVNDPKTPVVAVVLNTIDDALAKHDPGGTRWTLDTVQHLRHLLNAAALAGRAVILTSDHGHVVERGSEARPTPGAEARWRPVSTGPAGPGEVLVTGPRVAGGQAVLAVREDLRYTSLRSGYHGGASLAELTVPFLMFVRGRTAPQGWVAAPPQAPTWWHESRRATAEPVRRRRRVDAAGVTDLFPAPPSEPVAVTAPAKTPEGQGALEIEVPAPGPKRSPVEVLVDALAASEVYAEQRARAGRRALEHEKVARAVEVLAAREAPGTNEGRAHRDVFCAALGVSAVNFTSLVAALGRLLNVEGYTVISIDPDGVTVRLDLGLLREQFEIGRPRG